MQANIKNLLKKITPSFEYSWDAWGRFFSAWYIPIGIEERNKFLRNICDC